MLWCCCSIRGFVKRKICMRGARPSFASLPLSVPRPPYSAFKDVILMHENRLCAVDGVGERKKERKIIIIIIRKPVVSVQLRLSPIDDDDDEYGVACADGEVGRRGALNATNLAVAGAAVFARSYIVSRL